MKCSVFKGHNMEWQFQNIMTLLILSMASWQTPAVNKSDV